jgi:hypothetical protein
MNWDCGVIRLHPEIDQAVFFPLHLAEIKVRPICVVEPAGTLVDLGDDGFDTERQEAIFWQALLCIEHFALPSKVMHECRN